jgi:hypothetical protein
MQVRQFYNSRTTEDKDDLARSFSTHYLCHYLKLRKLLLGRGSYDSATRESPSVRPPGPQATLAKGVTLYRQPNLTRYITPFPRFSHIYLHSFLLFLRSFHLLTCRVGTESPESTSASS